MVSTVTTIFPLCTQLTVTVIYYHWDSANNVSFGVETQFVCSLSIAVIVFDQWYSLMKIQLSYRFVRVDRPVSKCCDMYLLKDYNKVFNILIFLLNTCSINDLLNKNIQIKIMGFWILASIENCLNCSIIKYQWTFLIEDNNQQTAILIFKFLFKASHLR